MADFNQAIKLEPDNAVAFNGRGNVYADIKQPDRAIADFTQAIKLDRTYARAYWHTRFVGC
jgi:tetratricopeptide (TPR) repeat protein